MESITLYHGTSTLYKEKIIKEGIIPRNKSKNEGNWEQNPSREDMVYLTDTYPIYFGVSAVKDINKEKVIIYKLKVDTNFLYPDEDFLYFLYKSLREETGIKYNLEDVKEFVFSSQFMWEKSLTMLGTVAHNGKIPPDNIIDYVELDYSKQRDLKILWEGIQPTISFMNKKICGENYQNLVNSLF